MQDLVSSIRCVNAVVAQIEQAMQQSAALVAARAAAIDSLRHPVDRRGQAVSVFRPEA